MTSAMMDLAAILQRLDAERRNLARDAEILEILPSVSRLSGSNGSWHTLIFSALTANTVQSAIDEQIEHYREIAAEFEWKVYAHDHPADLRHRLASNGFEVGPSETVMVLDLNDRPAWINQPPDHPVHRVRNISQIDLFKSAAEEIFGKDYERTAGEIAQALRAGSTHHLAYIAIGDEIAVSIGRLYTHSDSFFGGLYGGGTRKSHRGRGYYRALVAARAREAAALNARYLMVDALPTSRPILEKLGFVRLTETWPCTWRPPKLSPGPH